jgi:ATP-dependent DNA helicase Rep
VLSKLNPQQKEAVRHVSGPLLVLAGAGSGKTGVITTKIAWLVQERGMPPWKITAVTFTNKAAREMRTRVKNLLAGVSTRGLTISTFHTLGLNILRREYAALEYKPGFTIIDPGDALMIVRELMRSELTADNKFPEQVLWRISKWKNACLLPAEVTGIAGDDPVGLAAQRVYPAYERQLHACNALDLDDLILKPYVLLKNNPEILQHWREQIHYLLVDEYQDTNSAQYELVRILVGARGNLTVVGDDDQSIYAWRGAEVENLEQLKNDFHDLRVIKLEQNYRSMGRILKAANHIIDNNPHVFKKALWSELGYGDPIEILEAKSEEHEAERVVSAMMKHRFQGGSDYGDYAILYRGNHQARAFEKILREHRIPYFISGGMSFFDRSEIKDVMAYLRLVANHDDDSAFLRIVNTPRRGIGPGTLEKLGKYAGEKGISLFAATSHLALDSRIASTQLAALRQFCHWIESTAESIHASNMKESIEQLLGQVSYPEWVRSNCEDEGDADRRLQNISELLDWLVIDEDETEEERTLADCVANLVLRGILERNNDEQESGQVSLMTIHAAKGLEFPHVYVVGMEEGLLPHRSSIEEDNIEEERRLFYVAMTRAMRTLTLSLAKVRQRYGETIETEPSRFLEELPVDELQWQALGKKLSDEERMSQGNAALDQIRSILG